MSLWDVEMADYTPRLGAISPDLRLKLCVNSVAWTIRTLDTPILDPAVSSFVADGIERAEAAVSQGSSYAPGSADLLPRFNSLFDAAVEPGAFQFLHAVMFCFASANREIPVKAVVNLLSDSYEGALYRATDATITIEVELATPRALEVIDFQKDQIDRALRQAQ